LRNNHIAYGRRPPTNAYLCCCYFGPGLCSHSASAPPGWILPAQSRSNLRLRPSTPPKDPAWWIGLNIAQRARPLAAVLCNVPDPGSLPSPKTSGALRRGEHARAPRLPCPSCPHETSPCSACSSHRDERLREPGFPQLRICCSWCEPPLPAFRAHSGSGSPANVPVCFMAPSLRLCPMPGSGRGRIGIPVPLLRRMQLRHRHVDTFLVSSCQLPSASRASQARCPVA